MIFDHLLLLILAPFVAALLGAAAWLARQRRVTRARAWSAELGQRARASGRWAPLLIGLAGFAAAVALAGPRGGRSTVERETRALSAVFAIDISRSMLAEDVPPNRLQRAVREARRLVQDLEGDRLGLIAFAGRSYILTPLTVDGSAVSLFFDGLAPDLASQGGTGLGAALVQGRELLLASGEDGDRVLILLTDGETHDSMPAVLEAARELRQAGIRLVLVAQGSPQPARIPVRDSLGVLVEYQQDETGWIIETRRRDDVLQAVADAAEGALVPAELPDQAGAARDLLATMQRNPTAERGTADLLPLGWIPALAAVLLLGAQTVLRRTAALVALTLWVPVSAAQAQRPSPAERAAARQRPAEAAALYLAEARGSGADTALYNAGTAAMAAGDRAAARRALAEAARSLDPGLRYRALYNLGVNALEEGLADTTRRRELLDEAAARFEEALVLEPRSERAKWNLELVRRRQPPPPPPLGGGGANPPPTPPPPGGGDGGGGGEDLSRSQAEQILNSVDREERNTRLRHATRGRNASGGIKDW